MTEGASPCDTAVEMFVPMTENPWIPSIDLTTNSTVSPIFKCVVDKVQCQFCAVT